MEVRAISPRLCERVRETWTLHHLTDTHIDDPDHCGELLSERIKEIKNDKKALWIGGGDYGSLIVPGDKRFGSGGHLRGEWAEHMSRLPDYYLDRCEDLFGPIADKCVGLVAGNHEATIGKNYHRGVVAELASRLGDPTLYLGDRGWVILRFAHGNHGVSSSVFAYHGWSSGRLGGRKMIQAERDLGAWDADIFLLGHDHQAFGHLWVTESARHHPSNGWTLNRRPRAVVNGGSWSWGQKPPTSEKKKESEWDKATGMPGQSWVEGKNFRPQPLSNPTVLLHLDFGSGNGRGARGAGIDLEIRMRGDRVTI